MQARFGGRTRHALPPSVGSLSLPIGSECEHAVRPVEAVATAGAAGGRSGCIAQRPRPCVRWAPVRRVAARRHSARWRVRPATRASRLRAACRVRAGGLQAVRARAAVAPGRSPCARATPPVRGVGSPGARPVAACAGVCAAPVQHFASRVACAACSTAAAHTPRAHAHVQCARPPASGSVRACARGVCVCVSVCLSVSVCVCVFGLAAWRWRADAICMSEGEGAQRCAPLRPQETPPR
mmetsp:Transcript_21474/g.55287  ORF Transcript_21474/g.55287 Transcript_21474/m.55287 type:complete len:239 (+) Transcript_21474:293-1009(+)